MKWTYRFVLGLAGATMTAGLSGCTEGVFRTVVLAKGNNKLHLSPIEDSNVQYVIDCAAFPAGLGLYNKVMPGDTISGAYNGINTCVTVSGDTATRYIIKYEDLPDDCGYSPVIEDKIIQEMIRARSQMRAIKQKQR